MLEIQNAYVNYGKSKVINGVSYTVGDGQKLAILGRNGMGKTTLLKSIIGILPLEDGDMFFNGNSIRKLSANKRSVAGIGYVPQGREILANMTVRENLELGGIGHKSIQINDQMEKVINYFPTLKEHFSRKGGVLSGGQQQQLAIARCLMANPKILLLDEPTEGIQPSVVNEMAAVINQISKDMNLSLILVEQNLNFARRIAESYVILQKGKIVSEGNMEDLSGEIAKEFLSV